MADLHAVLRRQCEQGVRAALVGHEHPHDVLLAGVHRRTGPGQHPAERGAVALDPELDTLPRGPFNSSMGPWVATLAVVQHDDVVARELDVRQQMRREDEVHALVVGEVADQFQHLLAALRVHAVGRFVEEQQVRIVHEGLRELDALLHPGRVGLDVAVAGLAEAHVVEHLVGALDGVDRGRPESPPQYATNDTAFIPGMCASISGM